MNHVRPWFEWEGREDLYLMVEEKITSDDVEPTFPSVVGGPNFLAFCLEIASSMDMEEERGEEEPSIDMN